MNDFDNISPLMDKYQVILDKNPNSRVFAPLAESYRQLGLVDKAIKILNQGLKNHPDYVLAYLGLAFCYYDLKKYDSCFETLDILVSENRDNLRLQKLYGTVCEKLNKYSLALETYKYLLFINARDKDFAAKVVELEKVVASDQLEIYENSGSNDSTEQNNIFDDSVDSWVQVDFSNIEEKRDISGWKVQKDIPDSSGINKFQEELVETKLEAPTQDARDLAPVITHSLVDIYLAQGHIGKATELLNKILELRPNDKKSLEKLKDISPEKVLRPEISEDISVDQNLEEEGRQALMKFFDEKVSIEEELQIKETSPKSTKEEKLSKFLVALQKRAKKAKRLH